MTIERHTVHISDDTGRIAMLEKRTYGNSIDDHDTAETLTRYIYSNHLQSASLELDEHAAIISYEEYHPYGTTSFQSNDATVHANAKRYRYTGKERDEESGLYYHGARYYIPWLCRWSAVDPLESEYAGWSPYHYVKCNPVMDTDSTGMGGDKDIAGGWVSLPGKMAYNSSIDSPEMAIEVYGPDATYHEAGYSYERNGVKTKLGMNGRYTQDGAKKRAPDEAEFNAKKASWGWLGGLATAFYNEVKSGGRGVSLHDMKRSIGETAMSIRDMNDLISDESPRHDEAIGSLKHAFSIFSMKPSYEQGFILGGYSKGLAENLILAYAMGGVAPKAPVKASVASFEESFPGWYGMPAKGGPVINLVEEDMYVAAFDVNGQSVGRAWISSNAELNLSIKTNGTALKGQGELVFNELFEYNNSNFTEIQSIRGTWRSGSMGDNLATFNKLYHLGETKAAIGTYTGKMAERLGFTNVSILDKLGEPGNFYSVDVLFKRK